MRRILLSWPAKVMVIAVSAIGASGVTWAQPSNLLAQQLTDIATAEQDWIPAGSLPIPPKPKAVVWIDDSTALPAGGLIIPPKPKSTIQY